MSDADVVKAQRVLKRHGMLDESNMFYIKRYGNKSADHIFLPDIARVTITKKVLGNIRNYIEVRCFIKGLDPVTSFELESQKDADSFVTKWKLAKLGWM